MRQVGDVSGSGRTERFVRFLAEQDIKAQSRDDGDDIFSIWVINEDQLETAEGHLRAFKAAPDAATFDAKRPAALSPGLGLTSSLGTPWGRSRSRYVDVRTEIFARGRVQRLPVTITLIALSVVATLATAAGPAVSGLVRALYFSEYMGQDFPEIAHGQIWRLITPVFLHGGVWHLLFNMMWLFQLGGAVEVEEGSTYFALMTVAVACVVNSAQYLVSGPLFIGMSGVVYALLGYIWMMSRYQAGTRYALSNNTVFIMIAWMVVCLVGIIPGVANTQHVAGLIVGVVWGLLRSGYFGTMLRQRRYRGR